MSFEGCTAFLGNSALLELILEWCVFWENFQGFRVSKEFFILLLQVPWSLFKASKTCLTAHRFCSRVYLGLKVGRIFMEYMRISLGSGGKIG